MPKNRSSRKKNTRFQLDYTKAKKDTQTGDPLAKGGSLQDDQFEDSADVELGKEEEKSRSQIKRELDSLLKNVEEIAELASSEFAQLPLSAKEILGFEELGRIKSLNARQRQRRFIAKQLRGREHDDVIAALNQIKANRHALTQVFHQIEALRDRILDPTATEAAQQKTINELFERFPFAERQQVMQQVRHARAAKSGGTNEKRKLFRFLRSLFEEEQRLSNNI